MLCDFVLTWWQSHHNEVFQQTRHIEFEFHIERDMVVIRMYISTSFVKSCDQLGDILAMVKKENCFDPNNLGMIDTFIQLRGSIKKD